MYLFSQILSTILQVLVFMLLPFIVYVVKNKSSKGFFRYVGLYRPDSKKTFQHIIVGLLFIGITMTIPAILLYYNGDMNSPYTVQGQLREHGFNLQSLLSLLFIAIFKTAFAEEILFRGFIGKRLIDKFGYKIGNTIQAIVFGLIHTIVPKIGLGSILLLFISTTINGYMSGYLVEKKANGSIIESWMVHAIVNCSAFFLFAFVF